MEDIFNTLADIIRPTTPQPLNKRLLFKRAWSIHKAKLKHGAESTLSEQLRSCYKTAKMVGYENYKPSGYEITR